MAKLEKRFINGCINLELDPEDVKKYKRVGSSDYPQLWYKYFPDCDDPLTSGIRHTHCICGAEILYQHWIAKDLDCELIEDKTLLVIGSECINKFMFNKKKVRYCLKCNGQHQNRNVMLCNSCDPAKQPKPKIPCNFCDTLVRGGNTCCAKHQKQRIHQKCYKCGDYNNRGYYECNKCKWGERHLCPRCKKKYVVNYQCCYPCSLGYYK